MPMKILLLLLLSINFICINSFAQTMAVSGRIKDKKTQRVIPYANISIKGTNIGTVSNIDGDYKLLVPKKYAKDTLKYSYVGYISVLKPINNIQNKCNIYLNQYIRSLESITVEAKGVDARDIFQKAINNLNMNIYDSAYNSDIYSRIFISLNNNFILYRQTSFNLIVKNDEIFEEHTKGEVTKDEIVTNNAAGELYKKKYSVPFFLNASTDRKGRLGKYMELEIKNNQIIKIEEVIYGKKTKFFVIEVFDKDIEPLNLDKVYSILDNCSSPYTMMFDTIIQKNGEDLINNKSFTYSKYYIDAMNNYNVTKVTNLRVYFSRFVFENIDYSYNYGKSTPEHYTKFETYSIDEINKKSIYAHSLSEFYCSNNNYNITKNKNTDKSILNEYYSVYWPFFRLHKNELIDSLSKQDYYIKTDSLCDKAIDQIRHFQANPFPINFQSVKENSLFKHRKNKSIEPKEIPVIKIYGKVIDSITNNPIEFCNIIVRCVTDTSHAIFGGITNSEGEFNLHFPLKGEKYRIEFSHIGYILEVDTLDYTDLFEGYSISKIQYLSSANLQFELSDEMKLVPDIKTLNSVSVEASTNTIDVDKQSIIATKEMKKNTIMARDILEKVDGITYDRLSKELKLDGEKNIKLLVDGIDRDRDYVLYLDPKRIRKIEIYRNISGIYEIQGYTSVINIITYDNYRGVNVNVSDQFLQNLYSKGKSELMSNDADISINITHDKFNYYIKTGGYNSKSSVFSRVETDYLQNGEKLINSHDENPNYASNSLGFNAMFGTEYKPNNKHIIGFEANVTGFPALDEGEFRTLDTLISGSNITSLNSFYNTTSDSKTFNGSLYYNYKINSNTKFITYLNYSKHNETTQQVVTNIQDVIDELESDNLKTMLEFEKKFKKRFILTCGGAYLYNTSDNNRIGTSENAFLNTNAKTTGYLHFKIKFNKTTSLRFGSSYVYYELNNNLNNYVFKNFEPAINFSKKLNKKVKVSLDYRLTTNYPSIYQLNPQTTYLTPYAILYGNAELKPYVVQKISGDFMWLNKGVFNYLSVKPYFKYTENAIGYKTVISDSIIEYSNQNFVNNSKFGLRTNVAFKYKKKLEINCGLNIFRDLNSNLETPKIIDWTGDLDIKYNATAKQYLGLILQKGYYDELTSIGYNSMGNNYLMIYWMTLQLKGNLQIVLGYTLPVLPVTTNNIYENTVAYTKTASYDNSFMQNMFLLNLTYHFSRGKVVKSSIKPEQEENIEKLNLKINTH